MDMVFCGVGELWYTLHVKACDGLVMACNTVIEEK